MAEPTTRARQPKRPAHLPHGRWLGDLGDLSPFEKRLVAACARGEYCAPDNWDGKCPGADAATETNAIAAELIRFLALGGDELNPVHDKGIFLCGGYISGILDLDDSENIYSISIRKCRFDSVFLIRNSNVNRFILDGSYLVGFYATCSHFQTSLYARDGFENHGDFSLVKSTIEKDLNFQGSKLNNESNICLNANRSIINGNVYLCAMRNTVDQILIKINEQHINFESHGEIRFYGSTISGDLILTCGKFYNIGCNALILDYCHINRCLYFYYHGHSEPEEDGFYMDGCLSLNNAKIYSISDSEKTWEKSPNFTYRLHGLLYNIFESCSKTDWTLRTNWLLNSNEDITKKENGTEIKQMFFSQPWEQLIKVLREMGHPYDAAQVAMAKQKQLRKAGQIKGPVRNVMHWLYGALAGYGHRPIWTVGWRAAVWLICALVFSTAGHYGAIGPAAPVMMVNQQVAKCGVDGEVDFDHYWVRCPDMPPEYTSFDPWLYSLDLILPLVDLQQDSDWAPVIANSKGLALPLGWWSRGFMLFEILFGWMASLTLVAVLGRLVDKD